MFRNRDPVSRRRTRGVLKENKGALDEFVEHAMHLLGVDVPDGSGLDPDKPVGGVHVRLEADCAIENRVMAMDGVDAEMAAHLKAINDAEHDLDMIGILDLELQVVREVVKAIVPADQVSTSRLKIAKRWQQLGLHEGRDVHGRLRGR
jgi:hypothetical protein